MKVFRHNDIEMRYQVHGESEPVHILLHGFGGGPQDWSTVTPILSQRARVVIPNLKVFFTHSEPLTFGQQVTFLSEFIHHINKQKKVKSLHLTGQSYGATLSLGLRLTNNFKILSHVLLNPMPFHPFSRIRDQHVQLLVSFGYMPGGVNLFLRTEKGRQSLEEMAKVFRIGSAGHHEIRHFNDRKLALVEKAFDRFRWVDRHEDWSIWEKRLHCLEQGAITRFIYSSQDSLFYGEDYKRLALEWKCGQIREVPHHGHLLVQDMGEQFVDLFR